MYNLFIFYIFSQNMLMIQSLASRYFIRTTNITFINLQEIGNHCV